MPSSDHVLTERRPVVTVAMPALLRRQFFSSQTWGRLSRRTDVRILDDGPAPDSVAGDPLAETEILVTGWGSPLVDSSMLDRAPALRAVVHTGGSVKKVVTAEVYRRGVVVSSQAANNAVPVAEYTLAMVILALKGVLPAAHRYAQTRVRQDVYAQMTGHGSYRRTVGVVGASRVGRRVIALLDTLDVDVLVHDPYLDAAQAQRLGVRSVALEELARISDVVSIHAPLLPGTHGMIGASFLAQMREGTTIINTARGALIDEAALVAELSTGRLHAVLDVTEPDLPSDTSPLWTLPNVLLTPHVAGALGRELERLGDSAIDEVLRAVDGDPLRYEVAAGSHDVLA